MRLQLGSHCFIENKMFNLLPENEKRNILREYNFRRAIVLTAFLFALGVIACVSLFPSFLLSSAKIIEEEAQLASIKKSDTFQEADRLNASLIETNLKIQSLKPLNNEQYIVDVIGTVIAKKNDAIRINGFLFKRGNGKDTGSLTVSGLTRDRESLSAFVRELEKEPLFTKVVLPISNFTKDRNAEFSIQINGAF